VAKDDPGTLLIDRLARLTSKGGMGRRSFLARTAVVGSALATAPLDWALRPISAYAAVCSCGGSSCQCGSLCCDGYTEFCCTTTGRNTCPPGTEVAGWWKVDGSSFCGGPRYYMDCNATCGSCRTCGGTGLCSGSCSGTPCGCAAGSCNNRKTGCNRFRYGQCNQSIACLGPIVCRVVTCVPPWQIESTCTTSPATDPATRNHNRSCLQVPYGAVGNVTPVPGGVRIDGWAVDPEVTDSIDVHLYVDGVARLAVPANIARPDVAAAIPGWGAAHGFSANLSVANGTHSICAYGINRGSSSGNGLIGCRDVQLPGVPFGALGSVTPVAGGVRLTGWAIDPDTTAPIHVHGFVVQSGFDTFANLNRPDVAAAYPGYGAAHGFDLFIPFRAGTFNVCAFAINNTGSPNPLLGCQVVEIGRRPLGVLDVADAGPRAIRVRGWAFDPDTPTQPIQVHVYVDGIGRVAATADRQRLDVAAAFPGTGSAHGYDITVNGVAYGSHQVCTYGINDTPGSVNPQLGCKAVTLQPGLPVGHLDAASGGLGTVRVEGWAIDPDTTSPLTIHVYVDGVFRVAATADRARPDIAALYPPYGPAHGFDITVPARAGSHAVCVYSINDQYGMTSPQLGCATVTAL